MNNDTPHDLPASVKKLTAKGVRFPAPGSVFIGPEIDAERISGNGVTIHPGCRLLGATTLIADGVELGREAPVTLINSCLGPDVKLHGGFFERCVYLQGAVMGSGAHVRQGTIFEEYASGAHCVGVKQTILFPYVTLGSLINFCDCLMAGGTGPKSHSEVGSSYIHFNFTPHQDKATASLIGDVPRGVMLDQAPIFLGGQGGLVGPCRIGYGNVIAAGSIYRKDALGSGRLLIANPGRGGSIPFRPGVHINVKRILVNNTIYIANLVALKQWYRRVRSQFVTDPLAEMLHEGLVATLDGAISERIYRLAEWGKKIQAAEDENAVTPEGVPRDLVDCLDAAIGQLTRVGEEGRGDLRQRDVFLEMLTKPVESSGSDYLGTISQLSSATRAAGVAWLNSIVTQVGEGVFRHLPSRHGTNLWGQS